MRALADILHQSAHNALAKNMTLGKLLGSLFSGWLVFQSYSGYYKSHVIEHHRLLGSESDPDLKSILDKGLYNYSSEQERKKKIQRYLLRLFHPMNSWIYLKDDLWKNRIWQKDEEP
jgi:fatty acid desaturase